MACVCEVCGKSSSMGNKVTHRGKAKYLGGVGTKITGITRRKFKPNLQRVRVTTANGTHKTMRVCTQCIRNGAITKTIHRRPFKLATPEMSEKPADTKTADEKAPASEPKAKSRKYEKRAQRRSKKEEEQAEGTE